MTPSFIILTHVTTESINHGFLPEIIKQGYPVTLLTDHPEDHQQSASLAPLLNHITIHACDVFNPIEVLTKLEKEHISPIAVFSNSDHLQSSCAIVADFYNLPGKSWPSCHITKHKAKTREQLTKLGLETLWYYQISNQTQLKEIINQITYPCIIKPNLGVASINVKKIHSITELTDYCQILWQQSPNNSLLIEEFIEGQVCSIETLGNGKKLQVLGGFRTELTSPPHFIEQGARWVNQFDQEITSVLLQMINQLGVNFGACHTEFIETPTGPKIIEVNYRSAGDYKDFLLDDLFNNQYFKTIIDYLLNNPYRKLTQNNQSAHIHYFTHQQTGIIQTAPVPTHIQNNQIKIDLNHFKQEKEFVKQTHSNKDYLAALRLISPSQEILIQSLAEQKNRLQWIIQ
ncbi:ATP-grasp domain-containing protein [Piscirickettsia salmonis]|uniref:ATP-grasp domain-containing protein n=1 Tax=Piscirickettsia salmonis TaxID=1238 RepID=UPI0007C9599F|nr:argininosuccinate lyase [Piscirickettsiaceae bacterium NZ-RLO1]